MYCGHVCVVTCWGPRSARGVTGRAQILPSTRSCGQQAGCDQMRRFGMGHLVTIPSMEVPPHMEESLLRRGKRLATADAIDSESED